MSKRLSIAASILVLIATYANAQYYQFKWKFPDNILGKICNSFYTVPNYKPFDMDNDGVSEIVTYDPGDTNFAGAIYDGATYKLKYHIRRHYTYNGKIYSLRVSDPECVLGFYDINGDHVKELIWAGDADSTHLPGYLFINPFTDQVDFFVVDKVEPGYPPGFSDIDNDGYIEMITRYGILGHSATPVIQPQTLSKKAELVSKIYPNPIVNSARIEYYVPSAAHVKIGIFDISGKLIRTLVNTNKNAGEFTEIWDGKSDNNKGLAPGQYYYNIQIGDFVTNKKVILLQ